MAKIAYKDIKFQAETLALIHTINQVIDEYQRQGFILSVRQLYYQLVAADAIPNTARSYKRIAGVINDARIAGLMDWSAIEDRGRDIVQRGRWTSASDIIQSSARAFHMDMWDNQQFRLYVIVEKAALAGVLEEVCRKYDINLLAAKGYPSVSVIYEMATDHILPTIESGQTPVILHLGDHDPSGIDMTRDLQDRFDMFLGDDASALELQRIALNMDQIKLYRPPPNPAKVTDSRFADYEDKFGSKSWELDALKPQQLVDLIEGYAARYVDDDAWIEKEEEIAERRKALTKTAAEYAAKDL